MLEQQIRKKIYTNTSLKETITTFEEEEIYTNCLVKKHYIIISQIFCLVHLIILTNNNKKTMAYKQIMLKISKSEFLTKFIIIFLIKI